MIRNDVLERLLRTADRRTFLKALGVAGAGAVVGGAVQSTFRLVDIDGDGPLLSRTRTAMGTFVEITAVHAPRDQAEDAIGRAFEEMDRLIAILSRHDSSTPLSHLNRTGSLSHPPRELTAVVLEALDVHRRTHGAFDPTVKPLIDLLEASSSRGLPSDAEIRDALACVGADGVRFADRRIDLAREGMGVTLDGVAKGYIVDRMSDVLAERGVANHLVNAGGDIRTRGSRSGGPAGRPWTVAVEDPEKKGRYPDVIRMRDGAVATSGDYENFYTRDKTRHHIVDPSSGVSPLECASVTIRATTVMEADALSTAVFVLGPLDGVELVDAVPGVEALIVDRARVQRRSRGWSGSSAG